MTYIYIFCVYSYFIIDCSRHEGTCDVGPLVHFHRDIADIKSGSEFRTIRPPVKLKLSRRKVISGKEEGRPEKAWITGQGSFGIVY